LIGEKRDAASHLRVFRYAPDRAVFSAAVNKCPNGKNGCIPKENKFCKIATCAFAKKIRFCFECREFPCKITKTGPISYGYCQYLTGKE
jgi:hypothetical protein